MKKNIPILCLLLALLLLSGSCAWQKNVTPAEVIDAMCAAEKPLPAGRIYLRSAPTDTTRHLSDPLLATTFGNGSPPPELDKISDAACFFSYTQPCELAVFLCKSADGTDAVAKMCLRRLDMLKAQHAQDSTNSHYFENACVVVRGRWVILCVSSDPSAVLRAFRRAV